MNTMHNQRQPVISTQHSTVQQRADFPSTLTVALLSIAFTVFNFSLSFGQTFKWNTSSDNKTVKRENVTPKGAPATTADKSTKETSNGKTGYRIKTIVIDAGHGGHDPGCLGGQSQEKHIALGIAQKLALNIQQQFPSVRVIMTRDTDIFIPLYERATIANRNNADLFISIHCNYMPGRGETKGTETYVMGLHTATHNLEVAKRENAVILLEDNYRQNYDYDPNSPEGHIIFSMFQNAHLEQSILLADKIESKFKNDSGRNSRGVKQAGFVVLKETTMPSVLVETGFLSNGQEEGYLVGESGQQEVADALLLAFAEYKQSIESGPAGIAMEKERQNAIASNSNLPKTYEQPYKAPAPTRQTAPEQQQQPVYTNRQQQAYNPPPATTNNNAQSRAFMYSNETEVPVNTSYHESQASERNAAAYQPPVQQPQSYEYDITAKGNAVNSDIHFYVQVAATPQPVDPKQARWKNTGYMIEVIEEDNKYKYQVRSVASYQQAFAAKLDLQQSGYPDAFIVAYKQGKRISLEQAKREAGVN